ncbi:DUF4232 domain-containing protein [Acidimicrobiaceae bacterium USS-CC1]|uniref:DUF4232 domain-containing protein n=1 Tax=Acidiferrimicrobium australe TaxID=2664430 RepID=A0ABW9QWI7_9ACTN|nr:DUF4232 domain-containing protein [Acidiferrimicrobium australe]
MLSRRRSRCFAATVSARSHYSRFAPSNGTGARVPHRGANLDATSGATLRQSDGFSLTGRSRPGKNLTYDLGAALRLQTIGAGLEPWPRVVRRVDMRTTLVACLLALVVACGGCGHISTAGTSASSTPRSSSLCSLRELTVREYGQDGVAGTANTVFTITDDTAHACMLPRWASLGASWGSGATAKRLTGERSALPFRPAIPAHLPVSLEPQAANAAGILIRYRDINADNGSCHLITTFTFSLHGPTRPVQLRPPSSEVTWQACAGPDRMPPVSISALYPLAAVASAVQPLPRTTPTSTTTTVNPTTTSTQRPATTACTGSQLRTTEKHWPGGYLGYGLGHSGAVILFTNTSRRTCSLHGYPGAAGINSSGIQVTQARRTPSGYLGGLWGTTTAAPTVTLTPGDTASATIEGTDNPVGNATTCPTLAGLLVTPPNTSVPVHLPAAPADCSGLVIHPVVPGAKGAANG